MSVGSGQLYSHRAVVYCTFVLLFSVSWGCQHDLQYNGAAGQGVNIGPAASTYSSLELNIGPAASTYSSLTSSGILGSVCKIFHLFCFRYCVCDTHYSRERERARDELLYTGDEELKDHARSTRTTTAVCAYC